MRIAYLVDVHERFEAVPDALRRIGPVDLLVVGGDITTGGTAERAAHAVEEWLPLAPRLLALAGNMDAPALDARLAELGVALDAHGHAFGDVGVFGVSAAPHSPLRTPYELDEDELARRIDAGFRAVADCETLVFCPHAPPRDTACDRLWSGEHVGSDAVRAFVEREQPHVVLCGHIHEARGTDEIGASLVVNPGPASAGEYAVVEIGETIRVTLS